ncbi:serine incorporator/TMS membrane protein [Pisolithus orientalis]|uniref:serine incorporator/TMS membrane protein n=1 Tax=Pisolithus orientalis TaxID=936130 RepID=UPI002224503E|nr:serine incorporator/TMS membrane protein [Pisolithus orientalis]KAI5995762.1 serine incorporator/TMS membrane protein [Pisolithus orientalis]
MGLLFSLPLAGPLGTIASSCLGGLAFCFTSTAASMFCKSCNCNSSIATRVGFAIIFILNSLLAWLMKTPFAIRKIEEWSYDYIKMDCAEGKCYGVLAVHRICFALTLFHAILSFSLIGVNDSKDKRAAIQNGSFYGFVLVVVNFFIPNGFFMFWGNYIALIRCYSIYPARSYSTSWQCILVGSTAIMYIATISLTGVLYAYFAGPGCTLNQFFISFNLALCVLITILCVHPAVQERNPRSGLAQAGMVAAYCTYLIVSAVSNYGHGTCNPLSRASTTRMTTVVLGAVFTFLAIAYSTSRAATQSRALVGKGRKNGSIQLPIDDGTQSEMGVVSTQPERMESPRYQALLAAVEAGAIPASALREDEDEDEDEADTVDDERTGTRYNYSWFHVIFAIGAMYVAMLLTDWNVVSQEEGSNSDQIVRIGQSHIAMWMRIVSSWVCMLLYIWSLIAPVLMPDRFGD